MLLRVVKLTPHQNISAVLSDSRIDRFDRATKNLARISVNFDVNLLTQFQQAERLFRDREIDINRIELLQSDEAHSR